MLAIVLDDTKTLKQNVEHQNFTETKEVIPKGTTLKGKFLQVQGLRRGEPFTYKIFVTDDKKILYQKKVKPMAVTEVTLGADSGVSPTIINEATPKKNFTKQTTIGALAGAGAGWYFSKKLRGMETNKVLLYTLGGAILGFYIGRKLESRTIKVTKSK